MPIQITIKGIPQLISRLEGIPVRLRSRSTTLVERSLGMFDRELKSVAFSGKRIAHPLFNLGGTGNTLETETGRTKASIRSLITFRNTDVEGKIGSPLEHVKLLEYGGEVHGTPDIAIPTIYANTPGKRFNYTSRAGNRWIATVRNGHIVPLFLLKPSVKYRARLMFGTVFQRLQSKVVTLLGAIADPQGWL